VDTVEPIRQVIDVFLHLDRHLSQVISQYGTWTHLILFVIVFCETGLVVTPFLPGDSLLFAAGTFAALGSLDVRLLLGLLFSAAVLGNSVNYMVGSYIGPRAFGGNVRLLRQEYLDRTRKFYARHGGKTIILAQFVPIIRTFAPFVAGVGAMSYARFITYNLMGAGLWVGLFVLGGYFFGTIPTVRENFTLVILAIIVISLAPVMVEMVRSRRSRPA
jgi:membrane-associated protein